MGLNGLLVLFQIGLAATPTHLQGKVLASVRTNRKVDFSDIGF